ncbi:hypothetical protein [Rhizobium sp. RAF56]|jgi:hypothetical protein|uniref:hypothetical protein n=1 Tax=Rhizobium sp. RAF56 TaxID=3233062 RepID=UPI003F970266
MICPVLGIPATTSRIQRAGYAHFLCAGAEVLPPISPHVRTAVDGPSNFMIAGAFARFGEVKASVCLIMLKKPDYLLLWFAKVGLVSISEHNRG